MKKVIKSVLIIALVVLILCMIISNIPVFGIYSGLAENYYELAMAEYNPENTDVCVLDYSYVTGASWLVEKSTDAELEGQFVCLKSICNPRDLKLNDDFELDYGAKYVMTIEKNKEYTELDGEQARVITPKSIVITNFYYYQDGYSTLRFKDLSFRGKMLAINAIFKPDLRMHF